MHRPTLQRSEAQHCTSCMSSGVALSSSSSASQHADLHSSRVLHTNVSRRVQPSLNHLAQKHLSDVVAIVSSRRTGDSLCRNGRWRRRHASDQRHGNGCR
eukprot:TRINITY_DN2294_c0_g1_i2.p4 TRINITY_DN2294_c0_g1~~TRINITY_DN2294_c0_g1_i2.p4  ORF type:complete len:100 (-),score=1.64 TRINITY_DN2294_c0_g1_i2:356-655(-)